LLHMLSVANLATKSKNRTTHSMKEYLSWRWVPISCRVFLSILAFVLVWDNPSLINGIDRFMGAPSSQIAIAGILGWFSDSLLDKVVSAIPALQKDLPVLPPAGASDSKLATQSAGATGQKQPE
jgi:hypothetical protein